MRWESLTRTKVQSMGIKRKLALYSFSLSRDRERERERERDGEGEGEGGRERESTAKFHATTTPRKASILFAKFHTQSQ